MKERGDEHAHTCLCSKFAQAAAVLTALRLFDSHKMFRTPLATAGKIFITGDTENNRSFGSEVECMVSTKDGSIVVNTKCSCSK